MIIHRGHMQILLSEGMELGILVILLHPIGSKRSDAEMSQGPISIPGGFHDSHRMLVSGLAMTSASNSRDFAKMI